MTLPALIIEDDPDIVDLVSLHISDTGLTLESAFNGTEGLRKIFENDYSVLVLDWNLPGLSGIEICRRLRQSGRYLPIIMLTSRTEVIDRVTALEIGVDDYLVKPFHIRELNARIVALLRRSRIISEKQGQTEEETSAPLRLGELHIDRNTRRVQKNGKEIELTSKEYDLLVFLAERAGRPYTRDQLLERVWEYESSGYAKVVTIYIARLRAKIEDDPENPFYLETVRGVGYRFCDSFITGKS